jgi:hypothetical protein
LFSQSSIVSHLRKLAHFATQCYLSAVSRVVKDPLHPSHFARKGDSKCPQLVTVSFVLRRSLPQRMMKSEEVSQRILEVSILLCFEEKRFSQDIPKIRTNFKARFAVRAYYFGIKVLKSKTSNALSAMRRQFQVFRNSLRTLTPDNS